MTIPDGVVEQAEQCLRNIEAALAEAGATFADVVRVRYLLPDRADFEPCWPALRRAFGDVRPGRHDARLRPRRSPDDDRDRGHRAARGRLTPQPAAGTSGTL